MQVRVRLGAGLTRLSSSPLLALELPDGSTVESLYERVGAEQPDLAPALRSVLPVVSGEHVRRDRELCHGDEVALLLPVSGG